MVAVAAVSAAPAVSAQGSLGDQLDTMFQRTLDQLAGTAAGWYAATGAFEPSIVEWHRSGKADRPSGTARAIARRITDAHPAPVDHTADAPVPDEPVALIEIAVVPNGRAVPWPYSEGTFPLGRHSGLTVEPREPVPDLPVALRE